MTGIDQGPSPESSIAKFECLLSGSAAAIGINFSYGIIYVCTTVRPFAGNNPTFQFPPAPHLVAPDQDLDWQGGDFRRHNKMIARSATRKRLLEIIHSLICQSRFNMPSYLYVFLLNLRLLLYFAIYFKGAYTYFCHHVKISMISNFPKLRYNTTKQNRDLDT